MPALGLLGGHFGRPLLNSATTPAPGPAPGADPAASSSSDRGGPREQALMETLIGQTADFKGDAEAPVTLISFFTQSLNELHGRFILHDYPPYSARSEIDNMETFIKEQRP